MQVLQLPTEQWSLGDPSHLLSRDVQFFTSQHIALLYIHLYRININILPVSFNATFLHISIIQMSLPGEGLTLTYYNIVCIPLPFYTFLYTVIITGIILIITFVPDEVHGLIYIYNRWMEGWGT